VTCAHEPRTGPSARPLNECVQPRWHAQGYRSAQHAMLSQPSLVEDPRCREPLPAVIEEALERYGPAIEKQLQAMPALRGRELREITKADLADLVGRDPSFLTNVAAAARRARIDIDGGTDSQAEPVPGLDLMGATSLARRVGPLLNVLGPVVDELGALASRADGRSVAAEVEARIASARKSVERKGSMASALLARPATGRALPAGMGLPMRTKAACATWRDVLDEDISQINNKVGDRIGDWGWSGVEYASSVVAMNKSGWEKICEPDVLPGLWTTIFSPDSTNYASYSRIFPDKVFFHDSFGDWIGGVGGSTFGIVVLSQNDLKRWRRGILLHELVHMVDYRLIYQEMDNRCPYFDCIDYAVDNQPMTEYTAAFVQYKWMGYSDCVARQLAHNYNLFQDYGGTSASMVTGSIWDLLTSCFHFTVFAIIVVFALLTGGLLSASLLGAAASVFLLLMVLVSLDKSFG